MRNRRAFLAWLACAGSIVGCADRVGEQLDRLRGGAFETRLGAIDRLRRDASDDPRILPALAAVVGNDQAIEVRVAATTALGASGERATSLLLGALDDPAPPVRVAAALALAEIHPAEERSREVLEQAMLAGEGSVFLAVGRLGEKAAWATPTLIRLLSHPKARLRNVAAMTLGRIGPAARDSFEALQKAKQDPEPGVRAQAETAISKVAASRAGQPER